MQRDTVKTLTGLVVITLIVVLTFLYGNAQRQAQQKRDQNNKQQAANASPTAAKSATPAAKPSATPTPKASATPAPSVKATPVPTPAASAAPVQFGAVAGATNTMPATGPELMPLLGTGALVVGAVGYARSRRVAEKRKDRPRR